MPNRFVPLGPNASLQELIAVVNNNFAQLDGETVVKTFKQPGGNAIVEGKLPYEGGYGILLYDSDGIASIIIGILPDGSAGIVVAKPGIDVFTVFS